MAELFLYDDILNALIELELIGGKLYRKLAENAADLETRKLFEFLAGQEDQHRLIYQSLKNQHVTTEEINAEYQDYLIALLDHNFSTLKDAEEVSHHLESAIKKAKSVEMETILLLSEFKKMLKTVNHERIDRLMDEERKHLKLLYDLEKRQ